MRLIDSVSFLAAIASVLVGGRPVQAAPGCGEEVVRERLAQVPGFRLTAVADAKPGVYATYEGDGRPERLAVALFLVEGSLNTFQILLDAEGRSLEDTSVQAALDAVYGEMAEDPGLLGCEEFVVAEVPKSGNVYDALKERLGVAPSSGGHQRGFAVWLGWISSIVFFGGFAAFFAYSFVRRRRKRDPSSPPVPTGGNGGSRA